MTKTRQAATDPKIAYIPEQHQQDRPVGIRAKLVGAHLRLAQAQQELGRVLQMVPDLRPRMILLAGSALTAAVANQAVKEDQKVDVFLCGNTLPEADVLAAQLTERVVDSYTLAGQPVTVVSFGGLHLHLTENIGAEELILGIDRPAQRVGLLLDPTRPGSAGYLIDHRQVSWLGGYGQLNTRPERVRAALEAGEHVDVRLLESIGDGTFQALSHADPANIQPNPAVEDSAAEDAAPEPALA